MSARVFFSGNLRAFGYSTAIGRHANDRKRPIQIKISLKVCVLFFVLCAWKGIKTFAASSKYIAVLMKSIRFQACLVKINSTEVNIKSRCTEPTFSILKWNVPVLCALGSCQFVQCNSTFEVRVRFQKSTKKEAKERMKRNDQYIFNAFSSDSHDKIQDKLLQFRKEKKNYFLISSAYWFSLMPYKDSKKSESNHDSLGVAKRADIISINLIANPFRSMPTTCEETIIVAYIDKVADSNAHFLCVSFSHTHIQTQKEILIVMPWFSCIFRS